MKVRIKFEKTGVLKFIGHLDIMRFFQKAIRRAEIDIAYSTGFSPHQIMSFAAPLGVGLESYGEYFDIEVNSLTSTKDFVERLNQAMVPGMRITNAVLLKEGAQNAMACVAAALYELTFREGKAPEYDYQEELKAFLEADTIPYTKQTKKSEIELNLKDAVYSYEITDSKMKFLVNASSSGNIKPMMILEAFYKAKNMEMPEFACNITRLETFTNIGTEEQPEFVPLDQVGDAF